MPVNRIPDRVRDRHHVLVRTDNSFQQRARLLQALWREAQGLPVGLHRGAPLGSTVELGHAKATLANFLTDTIRDVVRHDVLGPGRDPDALINETRLFANLLSSQPLCFNLFGELARDLDLATRVIGAMMPGRIGRVTEILFEHSPVRRDPRFTGDRSAFDVFVRYESPSARRGFLAIEVKYHEALNDKAAPHRPRYLLRHGLAKGYRDEEVNGATFRGRLLVAEHLRANLARADRFYVRAQTYDRDIAVNQILGAALDELGGLALSRQLVARAAAHRVDFPEVSDLRTTPSTFDRLRPSRSTARYASALTLARMLLEHASPQLRSGRSRVFALLFDMNVLWERYVAALFCRAAVDRSVSTQERRAFWRGGEHRRGVRPDIVVRAGGSVVLIADTKWKAVGSGPPADSDLQQMFVYNELLGAARSVLVYPGVGSATGARGAYEGRTHGCATLHLALMDGARWSRDRMQQQIAAALAAHV